MHKDYAYVVTAFGRGTCASARHSFFVVWPSVVVLFHYNAHLYVFAAEVSVSPRQSEQHA